MFIFRVSLLLFVLLSLQSMFLALSDSFGYQRWYSVLWLEINQTHLFKFLRYIPIWLIRHWRRTKFNMRIIHSFLSGLSIASSFITMNIVIIRLWLTRRIILLRVRNGIVNVIINPRQEQLLLRLKHFLLHFQFLFLII